MNDKGYPDPTAEKAIANVCREQELKKKKQKMAKDKEGEIAIISSVSRRGTHFPNGGRTKPPCGYTKLKKGRLE